MKNKLLLVLVPFLILVLFLGTENSTVYSIENCSRRERCSENDYPYCVPNVNFNDCSGIYECWDGNSLESLEGDCTYKFDPDPPEDATPWPTPTTSPDVCQITPNSVERGYSGYVYIQHPNIKEGEGYYVVFRRDRGDVTDGPFYPTEEGQLRLLFLENDPLNESANIEIRRAALSRELICSGGIVVKEKAEDEDIPTATIEDLCKEDRDCVACLNSGNSWTALGCIPTDPTALIKWVFPYLLGLGGLVAFSLIVFSGIRILTSAGNPEAVQGAKETITSAITGLLFLILSLFLLKLIGVDILQIPGF